MAELTQKEKNLKKSEKHRLKLQADYTWWKKALAEAGGDRSKVVILPEEEHDIEAMLRWVESRKRIHKESYKRKKLAQAAAQAQPQEAH